MRAVVLDPATAGLEELLERRRRSGLDRFDEVWEGVLHMVLAPSGPHSSVDWQLATRSVDWLGLNEGEYRPIARSDLIELGAGELAERIDWPAAT